MPEKQRAFFICLLLAGVTLAVYWPATGFDFINYDDPDYILLNTPVQHGFTRDGIVWAFKTGHASNWHPLTWISHMGDCALYGLNPGGHHLTNLLFHAANAVLLFLVLLQLTGAQWRSALVAALFAWHPLHVESVAWVSERKDVLSTFFALFALLAYARFAGRSSVKNSNSKIYYSLALVFFASSLLAKPMMVTLPFVLILLDFWPLKRISSRSIQGGQQRDSQLSLLRSAIEKIPFFAMAVLDCFATVWAQRGGHAVVSAAALPLLDRVDNSMVSYVLYLGKMLWPANLAIPYPYHEWTFLPVAGAAFLLAVVTALTLLQAPTRPWLIVGWLWFLGMLLPVIGLVQVGIQAMADRYAYLPLVGIFIAVAWSIPGEWAHWPRPGLVFSAVTGGALLFLLSGTERQLQYWRSSVTLFSHTTQVTHDNILAEYNLGEALARAGDDEDAVIHYKNALAISPNRVEAQYNSQPQARYNLGLLDRKHKKWTEAETQFRECVHEDPDLARAHVNLGVALAALSRTNEAVQEFKVAAQLNGQKFGEADLESELAAALGEAGRYPEAISAAQKARDAASAEKRPDLAAAAEKRLESYRIQLLMQAPFNGAVSNVVERK